MTEERWKDLIRIEPDLSDVEKRSSGARRRALAEFRATGSNNRSWLLAPAVIAIAILLTLIPYKPVEAPTFQQQQTKMQFTLSDGTRVHWVFDDRFAL